MGAESSPVVAARHSLGHSSPTNLVAVAIVELLEIIDVGEQHSGAAPGAPAPLPQRGLVRRSRRWRCRSTHRPGQAAQFVVGVIGLRVSTSSAVAHLGNTLHGP